MKKADKERVVPTGTALFLVQNFATDTTAQGQLGPAKAKNFFYRPKNFPISVYKEQKATKTTLKTVRRKTKWKRSS